MPLQNRLGTLASLTRRQLSTSATLRFKFKLTEELSNKFEEEQRKIKGPEVNLAIHTKENPLIMARVSSERYKKVIRVAVPKHRMNEYLVMYIRDNDSVHALDENDVCSPGDWVLLKKDNSILDKKVTHRVERVVYSYGNYVDPLTGRRSLGIYYDDDMERLEKIKLDL